MKLFARRSSIACSLVLAGCFAASAGFAGVTTYVWNGTDATYGDDVAVTFSNGTDGPVSRIDVTAAEGERVVFTGTDLSCAADAVVCLRGLGSLVFSNDVDAAGNVALTSDFPDRTADFEKNLPAKTTATINLTELGVAEAEKLTLDDIKVTGGKGYYNTSTVTLSPYFPARTADGYSVQLQGWTGAWSKCYKVILTLENGTLSVTCVYTKNCSDYMKDIRGSDFDKELENVSEASNHWLKELNIHVVRADGRRNVSFAGRFGIGSAATLAVKDGINFSVTGDGIGAKDAAVLAQTLTLRQGSFELIDAGIFTNAMTLVGEDGQLVFSSTDAPASEPTVIETGATVTWRPGVVLPGAALASILAVTGEVSFLKYNSDTEKVTLNADYQGPLGAMFQRNIGNEMVARFQAKTVNMTYGGGLLFRQSGTNVMAEVCSVYDAWWSNTPASKDPWTWDYFNGTADRSRANTHMTVKNLTFVLGGRLGTPAAPTHMYYALKANSGSYPVRMRHVFRPGANRRMSVLLTGAMYGAKQIEVYDGATVAFKSTYNGAVGTGHLGLWHRDGLHPPTITVHAGGRVFNDRNWQNSVHQTIDLKGGTYAVRDPAQDCVSHASYAFFKGKHADNHLHGIRYSAGGKSCGYDLYLGNDDGPDSELTVTGSVPCRAENGFTVGGTNSASTADAPYTLTLDVADVTGDAAVDFTLEHRICQRYRSGWVQLRKTGAGTALLQGVNVLTNAPVALEAGCLVMGRTACFNADTDFSFEGGALEASVAGTYELGAVTVSAGGSLTLAEGANVRFAASSGEAWTPAKTLALVCDTDTSSVYFGSAADALTRKQQRSLRLNGLPCRLNKDGRVVPGEEMTVVVIQ